MKYAMLIAVVALVGVSLWAGGKAEGAITAPDAKALLASGQNAVLLDVRTMAEFQDGHIAAAQLLPYDRINKSSAAAAIPSLDTPVIVYCRSGHRSGIAAKTLRGLGYAKVSDLGSINNWTFGLVK